jgi:NitT/TauT family transport system substrate-binding protein
MNNYKKSSFIKLLSILLVLGLSFTLLAGCGKKEQNTQSPQTASETSSKEEKNSAQSASPTVTAPTQAPTQTPAAEKQDINIAALKGPTSMGMVKIMEDSANGKAVNNYKFTIAGTPDEISGGLVKGDYDIAAIPCNLASVLYNKSKGQVEIAGINTLGVLYIVETGNSINSVEDLKGKTIYSTGKGTTPEYTLNYLLSSYGLDPAKDLTIEYKSESTEVAALLSKSSDAIAMLPQPFVTTVMMNNNKIRIALDVTKEWDKISDNKSTVVTGVIAVNKTFLENNKDAVDAFLMEYEASSNYVNENIEDAATLIEKFNIFKAAVAKKAIPNSNITFIQGNEMQTKVNGYLDVLFSQNPEAVGGSLPGDEFYYKK